MKQKVIRVGNSLGVTIPADFIKNVGIKAGDEVEVKKNMDKNRIVYKFSGVHQQLPIAGNFLKRR